MKTSFLKNTMTKLAFAAIMLTANLAIAQAPKTNITVKEDKKSTVVFASSLRELHGVDADGEENSFDMILSLYFDVNLNYILQDPGLKEKLVTEFLESMKENGYKLPKKIKNTDYFEPYKYILDLPVYFNKAGFVIPADQAGKGLTSFVEK